MQSSFLLTEEGTALCPSAVGQWRIASHWNGCHLPALLGRHWTCMFVRACTCVLTCTCTCSHPCLQICTRTHRLTTPSSLPCNTGLGASVGTSCAWDHGLSMSTAWWKIKNPSKGVNPRPPPPEVWHCTRRRRVFGKTEYQTR